MLRKGEAGILVLIPREVLGCVWWELRNQSFLSGSACAVLTLDQSGGLILIVPLTLTTSKMMMTTATSN